MTKSNQSNSINQHVKKWTNYTSKLSYLTSLSQIKEIRLEVYQIEDI